MRLMVDTLPECERAEEVVCGGGALCMCWFPFAVLAVVGVGVALALVGVVVAVVVMLSIPSLGPRWWW